MSNRKSRICFVCRWALLCLFPFLLTFCCQVITLRGFQPAFLWLGGHFLPWLLTSQILLLIELALFSLLGRFFLPALLIALPIAIFSIANCLKEMVNGSPILVSDLTMIGQAGNIAGFLRPGMGLGHGTVPALCLLILLLGFLAIVSYKNHFSERNPRFAIFAVSLVSLWLLSVSLPSSSLIRTSGSDLESQAERNDRLGLLLGLYSAWQDSSMTQPDDYSADSMNNILENLQGDTPDPTPSETPKPVVQPNVVLLVSESFFDPIVLPNVTLLHDPVPVYHSLIEKYPSGTFLSNTYAGGTGNVEMELLTGIPSAFLGAGESLTTLSDPTAYSRIPSLAKAFSAQGYTTTYVHSYTNELYNRASTIPQIGFEQLVYEDQFPSDAPHSAGYLSDEALTDMIITQFESKPENTSLFLYGLSMENHQPYYTEKFDSPSGLGVASDQLNEEELGALDSLVHGLHDADAALGRLVEYFSQCEEPVLLVFLGDHLPGLYVAENETLYTSIGYASSNNTNAWTSEELKQMHSTDFLVWNNYDAELEVPHTISCTTLGANLLSWANVDQPIYFQWVNQASKQVLLYRSRLFVTADGTAHSSPGEEYSELLSSWKNIVYDLIYGEGVLSDSAEPESTPQTSEQAVSSP